VAMRAAPVVAAFLPTRPSLPRAVAAAAVEMHAAPEDAVLLPTRPRLPRAAAAAAAVETHAAPEDAARPSPSTRAFPFKSSKRVALCKSLRNYTSTELLTYVMYRNKRFYRKQYSFVSMTFEIPRKVAILSIRKLTASTVSLAANSPWC
jgi:hypothetical protein